MVRAILLCTAVFLTHTASNAQAAGTPSAKRTSMEVIKTQRLILRAFTPDDRSDVRELSEDWSKAPGPAFDKWPTGEEGAKGMTDLFVKDPKYFAVCLTEVKKVIGLIALNDVDTNKQLDLGHVILSRYQDNDVDREALQAMVDHVFKTWDVRSIVTRNEPTHSKQLAPLRKLGFRNVNKEQQGELVLTKAEWEQGKRK
jgi:RimJ/RimL family protein N-acetyltransferase